MENEARQIGQAIERWRERVGLSASTLAERIGKSRPMIYRYESGKVPPSLEVLQAIAGVFGIPLHELLAEVTPKGLLSLALEEAEQLSRDEQLHIVGLVQLEVQFLRSVMALPHPPPHRKAAQGGQEVTDEEMGAINGDVDERLRKK